MQNSKFYKRLAYYLGGVLLGFVLVYFYFGDRELPAVWPKGKVREQIIKSSPGDSLTYCSIRQFGFDTLTFKSWIKEADVKFGDSSPREKPCPIYALEGILGEQKTRLYIQSCPDTFSIQRAELLPELTPISLCP